MELRHLRYFATVGESLNFTKAAAQLRLAQPALSRQVSDLEEELGVDLFKRNSHGVSLTAEGKLYLKEAKKILLLVEESTTKVRAYRLAVNLASCGYPFFVAMASTHCLAKKNAIPVEILAKQPLVVLDRKRNSEFHRILNRVFAPLRPNIATESDSVNSLITEVGAGAKVAVVSQIFKQAIGKRLLYRPLAKTTAALCLGIAWAKNGDITPAGDNLRASIRKAAAA